MVIEQGTVLGQRYRIVAPLAEGAQARVYLGRDELRGREVVVKEVLPGQEAAIHEEYRLLSLLHHPNLVRVFDLLTVEGRPFLVEERASGPDFLGWARSDPVPGRVCRGLAAALRGLQYLHAQGAVHRDIKPDSLRVGEGSIGALPAVRLVDFGLARFHPTGETAGTLEYAAPEVLQGEAATPASDLYSLGVVLFEALSGHLPEPSTLGPPALTEAPTVLNELLQGLLSPRAPERPTAIEVVEGLGRVAGASLAVTTEELLGAYFPQPPLVGREAILERLERAVRQTTEGGVLALQLVGSGKTAVARQACALARLAGLDVLAADSPASLLSDPLLGALLPSRAPDRLATELADRLLAREGGLLVCLDGWSPADPVSAPLLTQLTGAGRRGLLLIWTGDLPGQAGAVLETMQLAPLAPQQVREVVRRTLWHDPGAATAPWSERAAEVTGGDPRLVVELLRAQIEAGLPDEPVAPLQVDALVSRRLSTLDDGERRLLSTLAQAPGPVPVAVLRQVAEGAFGPPLEALLAKGLLVVGDRGQVSPSSAPLRQQSRALLDDETRRQIHARYVAAWRGTGPVDPATLGHHLIRAGEVVDGARALLEAPVVEAQDLELATRALPEGEGALRASLIERAARLTRARGALERALELAAGAPLLAAELLLDAGQPARALEALGATGEARSARHHLLAARCRFLLGDYAGAIAEASGAERHDPAAEETVLLENLVALAMVYTGQVAEGWERLERALPTARGLKDPEPLARLLNTAGIALQRLGRLKQATQAYAECLELARRLGDLRFAATSALNLGTLAHRQLELGDALEQYARAAALARRAGVGTTLASALANEANLLLLVGDLDGAEQRLDRAQEVARVAGAAALAGHIHLYRAELLLARHDLDGAAASLTLARACFDTRDAAGQLAADLQECELLLGRGQHAEARERATALLGRIGQGEPERWRAHLLAGEACRLDPASAPLAVHHLELSLAHGRLEGSEWFFAIHAQLARAHAGLEHPEEAGHHAGRASALLDELRRRVPLRYRESFDASRRVRRAHELIEGIPRVVASSGPSADELMRLLEVNKELNRQLSVDELLVRILDAAIELTGAERGFALVEENGRLRVAASRNVDRESVRRGMQKFSRTIAQMAMEEDRPVVAADAMDDERFGKRLSVHGLKLRAVLSVPLRVGGRIGGALYVDNRFKPSAFTPGHVLLMQAFADQAGIALEAARLLEESAEHREALARAKSELETLNHRLEAQISRQAQELSEISVRLRSQEEELVRRYNAANLVGRSKAMRELYLQIDRVAEANVPVFIWGESGTGKELVARAIHYTSSRREHPFVTINCGAIPATLLESELFGHVRGAFTGALRDRPGLVEVAGQGTLFLDEVGDMPPDMQVKLLRVLQEGTFRRLGEERERQGQCRVLSASLHQLDDLVREGRFREDLYYRLNVIQLSVPPLRERREDIPLLVEHILKAVGRPVQVAPAAMAALVDHDWPGNVRQLENELQRAALLGEAAVGLEALSPALRRGQAAPASEGPTGGLQEALQSYERRLIQRALEQTNHNVSRAATQLGLHRVALHRKMRKLGLARPGRNGAATADDD